MNAIEKKPVWAAFPLIPWGSIGWRMGHGEVYWHEWVQWFKALPEVLVAQYCEKWPEPEEWVGFYAFVLDGTTPPWIATNRARDSEQTPPTDDEQRIEEPSRIRWMARTFLEKTNGCAPDRRGCALYVTEKDEFWLLCNAPEGQKTEPFLWFERHKGPVIGPDNTASSLRTARGRIIRKT